jgi:hypothetical protein
MDKTRRIVFIDETGVIAPAVSEKLSSEKLKDGKPKWIIEVAPLQGSAADTHAAVKARVLSKEVYGVVTVGPDLENEANYKFYGVNISDIGVIMELRAAMLDAVIAASAAVRSTATRRVTSASTRRQKAPLAAIEGRRAFLALRFVSSSSSLLLYDASARNRRNRRASWRPPGLGTRMS